MLQHIGFWLQYEKISVNYGSGSGRLREVPPSKKHMLFEKWPSKTHGKINISFFMLGAVVKKSYVTIAKYTVLDTWPSISLSFTIKKPPRCPPAQQPPRCPRDVPDMPKCLQDASQMPLIWHLWYETSDMTPLMWHLWYDTSNMRPLIWDLWYETSDMTPLIWHL